MREALSSVEKSNKIITLDLNFISSPRRWLGMISGAPSHCSGFPASSAASRHSGRSDRCRYPNEGEENRRVGDLIGYTWKNHCFLFEMQNTTRRRETRSFRCAELLISHRLRRGKKKSPAVPATFFS